MASWALAALTALVALCAAGAAPAPARPNILFVLMDDVGVDYLPAYGAAAGNYGPTPVMDALAASGTLFDRAYASPVCSPTRLALLTGEYPHRYGVGNSIDFDACEEGVTPPVDGSYPHLPRLLARAGYRTAAVGKWHLANPCNGGMAHPLLMGFEHHRGSRGNIDDYFAWEKYEDGVSQGTVSTYATTAAVDDALELIGDFGDDPWFLYCALNAPHLPLHAPPDALTTLEVAGGGPDVRLFRAALEAADTELGRLLAGLAPSVRERTLVVVMGDNGTPPGVVQDEDFSPAKGSPFEGGVHVPLLWSGPGVEAGARREGLVQHVDLFATFLHLAGLPPLGGRDGRSLWPHLTGRSAAGPRRGVYVHRNKPNGPAPWAEADVRVARDQRYKLILAAEGAPLFYDLVADPFEEQALGLALLDPEEQAAFEALSAFIDAVQ